MKTFAAYLEITAIALFFLIMAFGTHAGMVMQEGKMTNCPFLSDSSSLCQMNILGQIGMWHAASGSPLPKIAALLMGWLILISFLSDSSRAREINFKFREALFPPEFLSKFYNYLILFLSKGILHPKVYNFAF